MSISIIWTLAQKELRDALHNRWFVLYTLAFIGLALALSYMSLAGAGISGFAGFGRTAADATPCHVAAPNLRLSGRQAHPTAWRA